ncbi:MAG: NUDIX domain-containing protein [Chloroflexi bacterium]|nr:NUDIX domain-containing protein [Chloroflexota bacterium]MCY4247928.1 NUDIX domain-containing protein [Chloroflexota bacterium]
MSERFDIYDEALTHIGTKSRAAVHRDGDWHQVFHCWVVGRDAQGEFVILQKRGPAQDAYPGKVDISAAGHLVAGETVVDGVRELHEELGLRVNFDELRSLGRRVGIARADGLIDRQICHVFLYRCDQPLRDYTFAADEIDGLLKLRLDDGLRLLSGEVASVPAAALGLGVDEVTLTRADFIESIDNYVFKALLLAKRYLQGETLLYV